MTAAKRAGATRKAKPAPAPDVDAHLADAELSEALGSPRRPGRWLVLAIRAAVVITASLCAELLLIAITRLILEVDEE